MSRRLWSRNIVSPRQLFSLGLIVFLAVGGATLVSLERATSTALHQAATPTKRWAQVLERPESDLEAAVRRFTPDRDVQGLALLSNRKLLVGTSGGAFSLDLMSGQIQPLAVPRWVRSSAVRAVTAQGGVAYLGLEDGGVARLDGLSRQLYVPPARDAGRVRALAVHAGRILVTSAQGSAWSLDDRGGSQPGLPGRPNSSEPRLVAARAGELLTVDAAGELRWTSSEGRLSAHIKGTHVLSLTLTPGEAWVGTELGIYHWVHGHDPLLVSPEWTRSVAPATFGVWLGTQSGRVLRVESRPNREPLVGERARLPGPIRALLAVGEDIWAGGRFGLAKIHPTRGVVAVLAPPGLRDGHITALAESSNGSLLVGTFGEGLEELDPASGRVLQRTASVDLRQVNRILPPNPGRPLAPGPLVATSRGLFTRTGRGKFQRYFLGDREPQSPRYQSVLGHAGGLATAGRLGLSSQDKDGVVRALGTFHGLPSNKAYALAAKGKHLYVGTLGGLARVDEGRLARTWRPDQSGLPAGWVQALEFGPGGLYIGTFGGGMALLPLGELEVRPLPGSAKDINPGALLVHGTRVYAGSAGDGIVLMGHDGVVLGHFTEGLPSWDVSALAASAAGLWVGTTRGLGRVPWDRLEEGVR